MTIFNDSIHRLKRGVAEKVLDLFCYLYLRFSVYFCVEYFLIRYFLSYGQWLCSPSSARGMISLTPITTVLVAGKVIVLLPGLEIAISVTTVVALGGISTW